VRRDFWQRRENHTCGDEKAAAGMMGACAFLPGGSFAGRLGNKYLRKTFSARYFLIVSSPAFQQAMAGVIRPDALSVPWV
jgi:hypothetical protein